MENDTPHKPTQLGILLLDKSYPADIRLICAIELLLECRYTFSESETIPDELKSRVLKYLADKYVK